MASSRPLTLALPTIFFCSVVLAASFVTPVRAEDRNTPGFGSPASHKATPTAGNNPVSGTHQTQNNAAPNGASANNPLSTQATEANKSGAPKLNHASRNIRFLQQPGHLQLEARQATWPQLLETIEQHTGTHFHYASLPVYPVSLSLKGRTAQEVLTHLFGSATGYACRFSKSGLNPATGWPQEIWVMGILASNSQNQNLPPLPSIQASVKDLTDEQLEEAVQLHYQRELENLIDKAKHGTPDEKNQALVELSTRPEDEANKDEMNALLKQGLHNDDPDVRGQVIYGLASRGGKGSEAILSEGLSDEALTVRVSAVNAITADHAQGINLLKKALGDTDATVRSLAREKLRELGVNTPTN
jgi:HEAT repeats